MAITARALIPLLLPIACAPAPENGSSSAALTTVVYDNGDPTDGFGVTVLSELDEFNQVGDDFSLGGDVRLDEIQWWGGGDGDEFRLRIFEIAGGLPEVTPLHDVDLGQVIGTPETFGFVDHLFYSAPLPGIELPAGDYALSIVDQTDETWFWSASCEDGCEDHSFRRGVDGDTWEVGNWEFAFRLLGTSADGEVSLCHCPPGRPDRCLAIEVGEPAAAAHLERHPDDELGGC